MPYKGGKRKKRRTHVTGPAVNVPQEEIPKSIVAKTVGVSPRVADLTMELRSIMRPYTAANLKERKYNRPKDYLQVAGLLGVTHVGIVSQTESNTIYKIARAPQGPTLHFKVLKYSLMKHVRALQKHPFESQAAYQTPPLVVLNNFGQASASHIALMRATLQNMYPSLNLQKVKLNECRRVVLYHYNKEEDVVEQRHFAIRAAPVGVSRNVRKLVQAKLPNLGDLQDVSEFLEGSGANTLAYSDSEAEDEGSHVVLPESYAGRGNVQSQKSAIKLVELGPRLTLELFKVERGFHEGDVLYHKYVHKTPEEAAELKARKEQEREDKKRRREEQEENVQRKKAALEEKLKKKAEKRAQRQAEREQRAATHAGDEDAQGDDERSVSSDSDDEDEYDGEEENVAYEGEDAGEEEGDEEYEDEGDDDDDDEL